MFIMMAFEEVLLSFVMLAAIWGVFFELFGLGVCLYENRVSFRAYFFLFS